MSELTESKNEWVAKLVDILRPHIISGIKNIFNESVSVCEQTGERRKYLMTFQNMLGMIPQWSNTVIETECARIIKESRCDYLPDLISCVHIIQLKLMSNIRVNTKQKNVNINIPKLEPFIHKIYIQTARQLYKSVYLFSKEVEPLEIQKNDREIEMIIQESILFTIRDNIPTESLIRSYLAEDIEHEEEVIIEPLDPATPPQSTTSLVTETTKETTPNPLSLIPNTVATSVIETPPAEPLSIKWDKTIADSSEPSTPNSIEEISLNEYDPMDDDDNVPLRPITPSGSFTGNLDIEGESGNSGTTNESDNLFNLDIETI